MNKLLLIALAVCVLTISNLAGAEEDYLGFATLEDESQRPILLLWGGIDSKKAEADRFLRTAKAHPEIRGFWLASGGGNPDVAMEIGRYIRRTGLPVTVPSKSRLLDAIKRKLSNSGSALETAKLAAWAQEQDRVICASACGYLLMGGRVRIVDLEHSIGLHAAAFGTFDRLSRSVQKAGDAITADKVDNASRDLERDIQNSIAIKNAYIAEMSISLGYSQLSTAVPSQCMYYLSAREMTALNVTNANSLQTRGGEAGKCDCWVPGYTQACETSARKRQADLPR
jgi:hypothetical protein